MVKVMLKENGPVVLEFEAEETFIMNVLAAAYQLRETMGIQVFLKDFGNKFFIEEA